MPGAEDGQAIEMAFSKKKVEERKDWLRSYVAGTFLDHTAETISYNEFVHKVGGWGEWMGGALPPGSSLAACFSGIRSWGTAAGVQLITHARLYAHRPRPACARRPRPPHHRS